MTEKRFAGIGSRRTPEDMLTMMYNICQLLGKDGYTCDTGACIGPDQKCAEGTLVGGGNVHLYLPWRTYELEWADKMRETYHARMKHTILDERYHLDAMESVKLHPKYGILKHSYKLLHGRNYLIIHPEKPVEFILCWTPGGLIDGGTGQALRIAERYGIKVYNLGDLVVLDRFAAALERRQAELI